jgi:prepilin-type N-terminal cleavage/methylation domain-containing protein
VNRDAVTTLKSPNKSFTLVELIIVIIIVGILASIGLTQYNLVIEKSRTTEAKTRIAAMRNLVSAYYFEQGSLSGIAMSDLGIDGAASCSSAGYYFYDYDCDGGAPCEPGSLIELRAFRCSTAQNGRSPGFWRPYRYSLKYNPETGYLSWRCAYLDNGSSCFGLPP